MVKPEKKTYLLLTHVVLDSGFEVWRIGNWIICYRFADDKGLRWSFGLI